MEKFDLSELTLNDIKALSYEDKHLLRRHLQLVCHQIQTLTTDLRKLEREKKEVLNKVRLQTTAFRTSVVAVRRHLIWTSGKECCDPVSLAAAIESAVEFSESEFLVTAQLKINCRNTGLQFRGETPKNGNCFYEAVSDQLERLSLPGRSAAQLRAETIDLLSRHQTIQVSEGIIFLKDLVVHPEDYLNTMALEGAYADHLIVLRMARMLERDIVIVTSSNRPNPEDNIIWVVGKENFEGEPIFLGHTPGSLFQSLEPIAIDKGENGEFSGPEYIWELNSDGTWPVKRVDPFLVFVKGKTRFKADREATIIQRISEHEEEDDFIKRYLDEMERQQKGIFKNRHPSDMTVQYNCERHCKPKGRKSGPLETRANACKAFISFRFIHHCGKKAVVIRQRLRHSGHNPLDPAEQKIAMLSPGLIDFIETLVDQGERSPEIRQRCEEWALRHGKTDRQNRKYYPTLRDVQMVMGLHRDRLKNPKAEGVVLDVMCTTVLRDAILYYQIQPLVIVYQNAAQRNKIIEVGTTPGTVFFFDMFQRGTTSHGYFTYSLVIRDELGGVVPVAHLICSEISYAALQLFLQVLTTTLKSYAIDLEPCSFVTSCDMNVVQVVKDVLPNARLLLCWFYVLQVVYKWLMTSECRSQRERKQVIDYLRQMRQCTEKGQFDMLANSLSLNMPNEEVTEYIQSCWVPLGQAWSLYGRKHLFTSDLPDSSIEQVFLDLKLEFQGGHVPRRPEDLLLLSHIGVDSFHAVMKRLIRSGYFKLMNVMEEEPKAKLMADSMYRSDHGKMIKWEDATKCFVPLQPHRKKGEEEQVYQVDIARCTCGCPDSMYGDICKHVYLGVRTAIERGTNLDQALHQLAQIIVADQTYYYEIDRLELLHPDGDVSIVYLATMTCTCMAFYQDRNCLCIKAVQMIQGNSTIETYDCEIEIDYADTGADGNAEFATVNAETNVEYENVNAEAQVTYVDVDPNAEADANVSAMVEIHPEEIVEEQPEEEQVEPEPEPEPEDNNEVRRKLAEVKAAMDSEWLEKCTDPNFKDALYNKIAELHTSIFNN